MKKSLLSIAFLGLLTSLSTLSLVVMPSSANATPSPDAHAPIGVMGDHNHKQGEWMTSYRYSSMQMKGNRNGDRDVSTADVLNNFMVAPTKMTMEMHMFGLMYGVSDELTLMGMLPYTSISMDHVNRMVVNFTTETRGVGDAKLSGIYTLSENGDRKILLNAGISLPTGSIDERDDTPAGANQILPYGMQLGSGTYDLLPGITYTDKQGDWSWGSQASAVLRLGDNDNNYTLGNQYGLSAWGGHKLSNSASVSLRLDGKAWGDIDGTDSRLNPMMVPTARTDLRGGERIDLLVGFNYIQPDGALEGNRLAIEAGMPIYQNLDGPQLETDYRLMVGWQLAF